MLPLSAVTQSASTQGSTTNKSASKEAETKVNAAHPLIFVESTESGLQMSDCVFAKAPNGDDYLDPVTFPIKMESDDSLLIGVSQAKTREQYLKEIQSFAKTIIYQFPSTVVEGFLSSPPLDIPTDAIKIDGQDVWPKKQSAYDLMRLNVVMINQKQVASLQDKDRLQTIYSQLFKIFEKEQAVHNLLKLCTQASVAHIAEKVWKLFSNAVLEIIPQVTEQSLHITKQAEQVTIELKVKFSLVNPNYQLGYLRGTRIFSIDMNSLQTGLVNASTATALDKIVTLFDAKTVS